MKNYFVFFKDKATYLKDGIMRKEDKMKLDGIEEKANNYKHPASGVTAGTYRSVNVNAQGHVTGGSNPTTLAGYGITDAALKTHTHTVDSTLSSTSTNPVQNKVINAKIEELKKSGSDGKTTVANAITAMGVETAADADFATMASNIKKISTGVDTTDATATAAEILSGKTAYVDEKKVAGTMVNQGAKTASLDCGSSYTIPAGYHNGSGKVTANTLASQTVATLADAGQLIAGVTAYANGVKYTGSIMNMGELNWNGVNETYDIPAGYYTGGTLSSVASYNAGVQQLPHWKFTPEWDPATGRTAEVCSITHTAEIKKCFIYISAVITADKIYYPSLCYIFDNNETKTYDGNTSFNVRFVDDASAGTFEAMDGGVSISNNTVTIQKIYISNTGWDSVSDVEIFMIIIDE